MDIITSKQISTKCSVLIFASTEASTARGIIAAHKFSQAPELSPRGRNITGPSKHPYFADL
jgi:hypothetical protein